MSEYVNEVGGDTFEQAVLQSEKPVLVDFWAEWCGPCRALAPMIETVAKEYAGAVQVVKLNVDDHPSVAQRYSIQAIPTLILFRDGKEKERIIGVASSDAISRMIKEHLGLLSDSRDRIAGH